MTGMENGPFYVLKCVPSALGSFGGLSIDVNSQVLAEDGTPVANLYAAGEVAMGNFQTGRYVTSSTAVGIAVYGGALAAEEAILSMNH